MAVRMCLDVEISELCIQFQKNLNEDTTKLKFTRAELDGLPESFFEGLTKARAHALYRECV